MCIGGCITILNIHNTILYKDLYLVKKNKLCFWMVRGWGVVIWSRTWHGSASLTLLFTACYCTDIIPTRLIMMLWSCYHLWDSCAYIVLTFYHWDLEANWIIDNNFKLYCIEIIIFIKWCLWICVIWIR